jgi:TPP-dependent pyruvate/acetoin dehydrogenase alpha subunit
MRLFLGKRGLWSAADEKAGWERAHALVDAAVREAESAPPPSPGEMFDHVSATLSPRQQRLREELEHPRLQPGSAASRETE